MVDEIKMVNRKGLMFPRHFDVGASRYVILEREEKPKIGAMLAWGVCDHNLHEISLFLPKSYPEHFDSYLRSVAVHEITHACLLTRWHEANALSEKTAELIAELNQSVLFPALLAQPQWVKALFQGGKR